jgi:hypothetical protein
VEFSSPPPPTQRDKQWPSRCSFLFKEQLFSFQLGKVDRSKLYGFKEIEAVDEQQRVCELATLCGDGKTIVGRGGTAVGYLSPDGQWCDRLELTPVDAESCPMEPVPSSFDAPIDLETETTVDDYLEHKIRLIYRLDCAAKSSDDAKKSEQETENVENPAPAIDESDLQKLRQQIGERIYRFPFRYRHQLQTIAPFRRPQHYTVPTARRVHEFDSALPAMSLAGKLCVAHLGTERSLRDVFYLQCPGDSAEAYTAPKRQYD